MDNLKLPELKRQAKEQGIAGYSKMNKKQLVDILSLGNDCKLDTFKADISNVDISKVDISKSVDCSEGICRLVFDKPSDDKHSKSHSKSKDIIDKLALDKLTSFCNELCINDVTNKTKLELLQKISTKLTDLLTL